MATLNLATKFSQKLIERFTHQSYTDIATVSSLDSDFVGARTVKVYTSGLVRLNNYDAEAAVGSRYGIPDNLGNTVQELTMRDAKSFTYALDELYGADMPQVLYRANRTLKEQVDNVITPYVDRYRLGQWAAEAGIKIKESAALDKTNTAQAVLTLGEHMDNALVNRQGRRLFVKPAIYKWLKLDPDFIKKGDMSQQMLQRGVLGEIDGLPVVVVPVQYWPVGVNFMIVDKTTSPAPVKLKDYKIHNKPQGMAGALVEGLIYHDLFVLATRRAGVALSIDSADTTFVANPTFTPAGGSKYTPGTTTIALASATSGAGMQYTLDQTDPKTSQTAMPYNSTNKIPTTGLTGDLVVKAYASYSGMTDSGVVTAVYTQA
ncbi:MAG: chitobiase/beta-hexosaminidase C-terminal domain-containing protein [Oscillospiraceae bacterium]|jgi:hypothetical protein|nr:chitobiase/beta-hexosaminidase C-terminal domain-containing protein [Oscillospiraceae bacterium]